MVVVFSLMTYRQDCYLLAVFDFKQHYIARGTKRYDEFAEKRVVFLYLTAGEWKRTQCISALSDCGKSPFRCVNIMIKQKLVQPDQIVARSTRVANLVTQRCCAAARAS